MAEAWRKPADHAQRQAALDPERSFIVQAPAGSGKTGLLTQRFLRLLATAENPEEIVAITFTRKAAAEMRGRILQALAAARQPRPAEPWELQTWQLAGAALRHAEAQGWKLLDNPQRLRVRTIDSLCQYLAGQMPLSSGFGEPPRVEENAGPLYRAAARSALAELESGSELGAALALLLGELDNNLDALHGLLADMLERRDQWLPILMRPNPRDAIEQALQAVVTAQLAAVRRAIAPELGEELARLARYASARLDAGHVLAACGDLRSLPPATLDGLPAWTALADLLLTQKGSWRAQVDKRSGFPAGGGEAGSAKQAMAGLLDALRHDDGLAAMLHELRLLPDPVYPDHEWAMIEAMFTVLRGSAAHLRLVFREQGRVDFSETALAAQEALGGDLEPSDLALRLDYRLRHLLVDEFQDTSQSQHELLKGLTTGWQPGDGRTLFLVGDPMQSIYRFRKAEVGLFLDAWEGELGQLPLEPLQLTVNFRSERGVVDWVNRQFPAVFPALPDKLNGAVPYAASEAFKPAGAETAVSLHPFIERDDQGEAARMVDLIRAARERRPEETVAVLVRSKAHLDHLIQGLRAAGVSYQAVEIGALGQKPAVLDLMSLTLALLHTADNVSWLALLHGPLCGLTRSDLHALAGADEGETGLPVSAWLADEERLSRLSEDGSVRARACAGILQAALDERGRRALRDWVEGAWLALGGPACLADDAAAEDVEVYLQLLAELGAGAAPLTPERIREGVERLFSLPDPRGDPGLQLMTIHKAKGLEFDTVILPGLGKSTQGDRRKLLYWQEVVGEDGDAQLLFGPVKAAQRGDEPRASAWIKRLQAEMDRLENGRLLYVAATRARRRLHLLGHAAVKKNGELTVSSGSLLSQLWPAVEDTWQEAAEACATIAAGCGGAPPDGRESEAARPALVRWRLPSGWSCPQAPDTVGVETEPGPEVVGAVVYEWAGDTARAVGTVVHAWLQRLVQAPVARLADIPSFEAASRRMLSREGVPGAQLGQALQRVQAALAHSLSEERGRWILSCEHEDSRCEVPLTALIDGQLRHLVIDRTFVDGDGVRWIIDYKTGVHLGGDLGRFLDEEQERYRAQLERYAEAFRQLEQRDVRTALYYPLVPGGWREIRPGGRRAS
ncbi:MAG TPA: UvrD-helicase domain-containing protein [Xanthomonadales bacterium]|nr:UvrD-helicase domain-containing protein [Xanthomonadales bacterium]